jgi:hypothetical protein
MVPHSACCAAQVVGVQEPLLVVVEDALLDVAASLELVALDVAARDPDALLDVAAPPPTPCDPPPDPAPFEEPQAIALTHPAAAARRTDARNAEPRRVPLRRSRRDAVTRPMNRASTDRGRGSTARGGRCGRRGRCLRHSAIRPGSPVGA